MTVAAAPRPSAPGLSALLAVAIILSFGLALAVGLRALKDPVPVQDPAALAAERALDSLLSADQMGGLSSPTLTVGEARAALSAARRTHARWQGQPSVAPAAKTQLDQVIRGALSGLSARLVGLPDDLSLSDQSVDWIQRVDLVRLAIQTYRVSLPPPIANADPTGDLLIAGALGLVGLMLLSHAVGLIRRRRSAPIPGQRLIAASDDGEQLVVEFQDDSAEAFADVLGGLDQTAATLADGAEALAMALEQQHQGAAGQKQAAEDWRRAAEDVSKAWRYSQQKAAKAWQEAGKARDAATSRAIKDALLKAPAPAPTTPAQTTPAAADALGHGAQSLLEAGRTQLHALTDAANAFTTALKAIEERLDRTTGQMTTSQDDIAQVAQSLGGIQATLHSTLDRLDTDVPAVLTRSAGLGDQLAQTTAQTQALQGVLEAATAQLTRSADGADALQARLETALDSVAARTQQTAEAQARLTQQLEALMDTLQDSAQTAAQRRESADGLIRGLEQVLGQILAKAAPAQPDSGQPDSGQPNSGQPEAPPVSWEAELGAVRRGLSELAQWLEASQKETAARLDLMLFSPVQGAATGIGQDAEVREIIRGACVEALAPLTDLAEDLRTHAAGLGGAADSVQQQAATANDLLTGAVSAVDQVTHLSQTLTETAQEIRQGPAKAEARLEHLADQLAATQRALSLSAEKLASPSADYHDPAEVVRTSSAGAIDGTSGASGGLERTIARLESLSALLQNSTDKPDYIPAHLSQLLDQVHAEQALAGQSLANEIERLTVMGHSLSAQVDRLACLPTGDAALTESIASLQAIAQTLEAVGHRLGVSDLDLEADPRSGGTPGGAQPASAPVDLSPVIRRLDALLMADLPQPTDVSGIEERLDALLLAQDRARLQAQDLQPLLERVADLGRIHPDLDLAPILSRLDSLAQAPVPAALSALHDRLDHLVQSLGDPTCLPATGLPPSGSAPPVTLEAVRDQLAALKGAVLGLRAPEVDPSLPGVQQMLALIPDQLAAALAPVREALNEGLDGQTHLCERLEVLAESPALIAALTERLDAAFPGDAAPSEPLRASLSGVHSQLEALQRQVDEQPSRDDLTPITQALEALHQDVSRLGEEMGSLTRAQAALPAQAASLAETAATLAELSRLVEEVGLEAQEALARKLAAEEDAEAGDIAVEDAPEIPQPTMEAWAGAAESILSRAREAMDRLAPLDQALPEPSRPAKKDDNAG